MRLDEFAQMDDDAHTVPGQAMIERGLPARAYDKIRRVARTLADLEGEDRLRFRHVSEAVEYQLLLDRKV